MYPNRGGNLKASFAPFSNHDDEEEEEGEEKENESDEMEISFSMRVSMDECITCCSSCCELFKLSSNW